jgi:hypothetical protein
VHRKRFDDIVENITLANHETLLDFGTGTGLFLTLLSNRFPTNKMIGFEPAEIMLSQAEINTQSYPNIHLVSQLDKIDTVQVITCLEVLEHFHPIEQEKMIRFLIEKLDKSGTLIISVPVEHGLIGLFKSGYRLFKGYISIKNLPNIVKTVFGISYRKYSLEYDSSHYGYSLINFNRIIKSVAGTCVKKITYSPIGVGGALINSQKNFIINISK